MCLRKDIYIFLGDTIVDKMSDLVLRSSHKLPCIDKHTHRIATPCHA